MLIPSPAILPHSHNMVLAMPEYKTTFFFEGAQKQLGIGGNSTVGFTETWYQTTTDLERALTRALLPGNYISPRVQCLPRTLTITWVRVSEVDNPRATKVGYSGQDGALVDPMNNRFEQGLGQITCAVLADFTVLPGVAGTSGHHRRFLLRGLTPALTDNNVINPASLQYPKIRQFLDWLGKHQLPADPIPAFLGLWHIRCNIDPVVEVNITGLVPSVLGPTLIDVTLQAPTALAIGTKVRISGCKFPRGVNREWTVYQQIGALGAQYTLSKSRFAIAGTFQPPAVLRQPAFAYVPPNQYVIVGLRERKTGRPSRLPRGRRSAV